MPYDIPSQQPTDDDDFGLNMAAIFSDDTSSRGSRERQAQVFNRDIWKEAYRKNIIESENLDQESKPVNVEAEWNTAGACLQNTIRTMQRLLQLGVPANQLRALYIINRDENGNATFLHMPNDERIRAEEQVSDGGTSQEMAYHVTVLHRRSREDDLLDYRSVYDLTTSLDYWGRPFEKFLEDIIHSQEENANAVGYLLTLDDLLELNLQLIDNNKFDQHYLDEHFGNKKREL